MSDSYTKLFSSITESTIWSEAPGTRLVWISFLAKCNKRGEVYGSIPGIARMSNVSIEEAQIAIDVLLSPDKWSRTPDNEGRRIAEIDGGWRILNHAKFDSVRNAEERAEYKRQWDREHRGNRPSASKRNPDKPPTNPDASPTDPAPLALTPVNQKQDQKKKQPSAAPTALPYPSECVDPDAWAGFVEMRIKTRHPMTARAAKLVIAELEKLRRRGHDPTAVLDQSTRNGWRDVFEIKTPGAQNGTNRESAADRAARYAREGDEREIRERGGLF